MSTLDRHLPLKNAIHAEAADATRVAATRVAAVTVRCLAVAVVESPNARPAFRTTGPTCRRHRSISIFGLMLATWTFGMASVTAAVSQASTPGASAIASRKIVAAGIVRRLSTTPRHAANPRVCSVPSITRTNRFFDFKQTNDCDDQAEKCDTAASSCDAVAGTCD